MVESAQQISAYLGYPRPVQFLERLAGLSLTGVVGTVAAKVFVPSINLRSHAAFAQVSILTFSLIFFNQKISEKIEQNNNPEKRKLVFIAWWLTYSIVPCIMGKVVVSKQGAPLTFPQSFARGFYYGLVATASSYMYYRHRRDQRK